MGLLSSNFNVKVGSLLQDKLFDHSILPIRKMKCEQYNGIVFILMHMLEILAFYNFLQHIINDINGQYCVFASVKVNFLQILENGGSTI